MNYNKMTVRDVPLSGKKVLLRCDFNVPQDKTTGEITSDKRIVAALPTIRYLLDHKAKVILCSHLGRPKGKADPKYSLAPVAARLATLLPETKIRFATDTIGESAHQAIDDMQPGEIVLLADQLQRIAIAQMLVGPGLAAGLFVVAQHHDDDVGVAGRGHGFADQARIDLGLDQLDLVGAP